MVYDPKKISYEHLLKTFWENHDPTQGMRQGNDVGTQYRSRIYTYDEPQRTAAEASRAAYQQRLLEAGFELAVYDPRPEAVETLTARGALGCTSCETLMSTPGISSATISRTRRS